MTLNYKKKLGSWGEQVAERFLHEQGYQIIERHWQKQQGEIDIIAYEARADCLVFIEVKTRTSDKFGSAEESVDVLKRNKLEMIINLFVAETKYSGNYRFDLVVVYKGRQLVIRHYQNLAFD